MAGGRTRFSNVSVWAQQRMELAQNLVLTYGDVNVRVLMSKFPDLLVCNRFGSYIDRHNIWIIDVNLICSNRIEIFFCNELGSKGIFEVS